MANGGLFKDSLAGPLTEFIDASFFSLQFTARDAEVDGGHQVGNWDGKNQQRAFVWPSDLQSDRQQ